MHDEKFEQLLVALWHLPCMWQDKQAFVHLYAERETDPSLKEDLDMLWGIANDFAHDEWKFIERS